MNDLTKEELECIFEEVNHLDADRCEFTTNLLNKIQFMIDNYCEHSKNVWPLYTAWGDLPAAGFCYECNQSVERKFINE